MSDGSRIGPLGLAQFDDLRLQWQRLLQPGPDEGAAVSDQAARAGTPAPSKQPPPGLQQVAEQVLQQLACFLNQ